MYSAEKLQVGDKVGIDHCGSSYGTSRIALAKVVKTTKTTVTVMRAGSDRLEVFNVSNAKERGAGSSWFYDRLVSYDEYLRLKGVFAARNAQRAKADKRKALIDALTRSVDNDNAFAEALQSLNQQEYAL
jgi:hypothetical protein